MFNSTYTRFQDFKNGALLALANVAVALLLFAGVLSLYEGLGRNFGILDYPTLKLYGIPIGLLLLALGMVTARLWIFESDGEDHRRRQATPRPAPHLGVVPPLLFGPAPAAPANENHAPNVGIPKREATSMRYLCQHTLYAYDATSLVGLRTVVHNGAIESIDENGAVRIDLPNLDELRAAVAMLRCLLPIKLLGRETRVIRRFMGLNPSELLEKLGEQAPSGLISRWESEELPMDDLTEKRLRQVVCEELGRMAPHLDYDFSKIAEFRIVDPWSRDPTYELPPVVLNWVQVKGESGSFSGAWNDKWAA
jgi:hypothetical protein